jgi:uncharacterized membrane protein
MAYLAKPTGFGSHRIGIISSYLNTQDKAENQVMLLVIFLVLMNLSLLPASTSLSAAKVKNPEYSVLYQQDKLIMSALISSFFENLLAHVFGLKTSREVRVTLDKMFAFQSKARVLQNRLQLTSLKNGALSIANYFQKE